MHVSPGPGMLPLPNNGYGGGWRCLLVLFPPLLHIMLTVHCFALYKALINAVTSLKQLIPPPHALVE